MAVGVEDVGDPRLDVRLGARQLGRGERQEDERRQGGAGGDDGATIGDEQEDPDGLGHPRAGFRTTWVPQPTGGGIPDGRQLRCVLARSLALSASPRRLRSTPWPASSPTSACPIRCWSTPPVPAIAAGDPASARARAEAVAAALLRPVDQRHRRAAAHQPRPGAAAGAARRRPGRYANLEFDLVGGPAGSRGDHAAAPAGPGRGRRGRPGRQQRRRRRAAGARRPGPGPGRRRVPRASWSRSAAASGCPRSWPSRAPGWSRSAPPTAPASPTTGPRSTRRRRRGPGAEGPPVELPHGRVHRGGRRGRAVGLGPAGRRRPRLGPARRGHAVAGRGPPAWLAGEPAARQTLAAGAALSPSRATSCSAGRRPGSSPAGPTSSPPAPATRWPGPAARRPRARRPQETALAYLRATATPSRSGAWPRRRSTTCGRGPRRSASGTVVDTVAVAGGGSVPGQDVPSAGIGRRRRPRRRPAGRTTRRSSPGSTTAAPSATCAPSTPPTTVPCAQALHARPLG